MHVRAWVADMSAKGLAPATINAAYRPLARILKTAAIDGYIARTPCVGIRLPQETAHEEMRFLEPDQVAALAEAIDGRYQALIFTAAYTGLRWGELAGLQNQRMNVLRASLDVFEALTEVDGRLELGATKTGARRTVALPRFLCDMLGEHAGRYSNPEAWVFTAAEGGPLRRSNFYRRHYKPAVARAARRRPALSRSTSYMRCPAYRAGCTSQRDQGAPRALDHSCDVRPLRAPVPELGQTPN
jgi:integrase